MELPPPHVLARLDAIIVGQESSIVDEGDQQTLDDDDRSVSSEALGISSSATSFSEHGARTTLSRFWGVTWDRRKKKWLARYMDANGKQRHIGSFDDEEEAARAVNKAISDAGLQGRRRTNAVDATGALVPRERTFRGSGDRSAVVAPDPERDPTAPTSKYWGVTWCKRWRRWKTEYRDADGKGRFIGYFDTQEAAAHAVNAAIRRAGLEGKRRTNPVVDGQLVPRETHKRSGKRHREEPAATNVPPPTRARRPRRAVDYAAMNDPGLEDGGDGSD